MKKFSIFLLTIVAFIGFTACEHDDDVVFVAQPDPEGIMFVSTTAESYTLTSQTADNTAERFVWSEVDFDAPTTVTYELQGAPTSDFSDLTSIGTTGDNNLGVTVSQMMTLAAAAGLDNDPETEDMPNSGQIFFRVRAYAGNDGGNGLSEVSETMAINVILPEAEEQAEPAKMNLFFVGDATAAGWNNNNNNTPLFRHSDNDNMFSFTGRFAGGDDVEGFKLLEVLGQWQPQWGGTDGTLAVNAGDSDDPAAFSVDSDAYYTLNLNTEDMTYTFESYDASGAATYDFIGLVGAGTTVGWPSDDNPEPDIALTKSTFDPHIWYAEGVELMEDGIKFRANKAWDTNWGGGQNFPSGQSTGDDIIVSTAGTYNVWFNDLTGRYIFLPVAEE